VGFSREVRTVPDVDQVKRDTQKLLEIEDPKELDYITPEFIADFEHAFPEHGRKGFFALDDAGNRISDPPGVTEPDMLPQSRVYYGNRPVRLYNCLYWWSDASFSACGTKVQYHACIGPGGSFTGTPYQPCGAYWGYRFYFIG
jgi:hypothetical protein